MPAANPPNGPRNPASVQGSRPPASAMTGVIRRASQSTGANFEYLLATAKVESNLNPNLTMQSSTATGLFQFLEQTWLGVMHSAGRAFGYGEYADAITQTKSGQYVVQDPVLRREMMQLRKDPAANAAMGGVFTQQNTAVLSKRIGRKPTDGELYIAHFFGPYAASKVIETAKSNPTANAADMFPAAAAANRPIFYDKQGNARSVAGVQSELVRRYQVARARTQPDLAPSVATAALPVATPIAAAPGKSNPSVPPSRVVAPVRDTAGITEAYAAANTQPVRTSAAHTTSAPVARPASAALAMPPAFHPVTRSETASVFHSLFETEGQRGAVSPAVAELWGASAARARAQDAPSLPALPELADPQSSPGAPLDLLRDRRPGTRRVLNGRV